MANVQLEDQGAIIKAAYEGENDTNAFTDSERTKLSGISSGATANSTDAELRDRSTHTGTQIAATISDFSTAATSIFTAGFQTSFDTALAAVSGDPDGIAPLDADGKIDPIYLSDNAGLKVPTFRIIGDSIASQNASNHKCAVGDTSQSITFYPYWWNMAVWLMGNSIQNVATTSIHDNLRYGTNSGIGGDDMSEVIARLPDILDNMTESHLVIVVGTNDANAGGTTLSDVGYLPTMNANFITITEMTLAAGITPIWTTILPRNAVDGANDWGTSGGTTQAQKRKVVNAHNNYRMTYCREHGLICVPWHTRFSAADGQAITGNTVEGVHPDGTGGYQMALDFVEAIGSLVPKAWTSFNAYDVYDATYNPYGNILNGALSGTGGNISSGSGTGAVTGTVPDGFQLQKATSTTTDCAAAIVGRSDGTPGNVLELTFTTHGTGNANENWRFNYYSGSSTSLSSFANSGDLLEMDCEIEYVSGHGGAGKAAGVRVGTTGTIARTATTISFDASDNSINDSANGFGSFVSSRVAVIGGSASNNRVVKILTAAAGKLVIDPSTPVVTESAGASISVTIPSMAVSAVGSSTTKIPDADTPIIYNKTPIMEMPFTGNIAPRLDIFVDGTKTGVYKLRIARPRLRKLPFAPAALSFLADDN